MFGGFLQHMEDTFNTRYHKNSENRILEWYKLHEIEEKQYMKKIDMYLADGTITAKQAICNLVEQDGFIDNFKTRNNMSYIINAVNIYYRELDANEQSTIFDIAYSIDDIISLTNRIRFSVWELEYTEDEESAYLLCDLIQNNHISATMLLYILDAVAINKYLVSMKLSDGLKNKKMFKYQLHILLFIADRYRGDETALCELAQLYLKAGYSDLARNWLNQINQPGSLTERVRREHGL